MTKRLIIGAGLALILTQTLYRVWGVFGGWFHIDDFNFISITTNTHPLSKAVMTNYWGHRMPGAFFLSWFNDDAARWNWALPAAELVLLQLLASLGLFAVLIKHFPVRTLTLVPLTFYLFTASTVPPSIWWASAINLLPMSAALIWMLYFHLNYLRGGARRNVFWACGAMLLGLAFSEKSILALLAVGLVTLCWYAEGRTISGRIVDSWRRYRFSVLLYLLVGAAYGAAYWLGGGLTMVTDERISGRFPVFSVIGNMIFRAYVPGLIGGPWRWMYFWDQPHSVADPSTGMMIVAAVAVIWVVWQISRSWTGWRMGLLLPVAFLAANAALVSLGRVIYVGPFLTREYRYQGELALVTALGLAAMMMRWRGALSGPAPRNLVVPEAREGETAPNPWRLAEHPRAVVGLVAVVSVSALFSGISYTTHWQGFQQGHDYTKRLAKTAAALPPGTAIADVRVSGYLTNAYRYPENTVRHMFRAESKHLAFTKAAVDDLLYPQEDGSLPQITIPVTRQSRPGTSARCPYDVTSPVTIALDGPVAFGGWWLQIDYTASGPSEATVSSGDVTRHVSLPAGTHTAYLAAGDEFRSVGVYAQASQGTKVCVTRVVVGQPEVGDLP